MPIYYILYLIKIIFEDTFFHDKTISASAHIKLDPIVGIYYIFYLIKISFKKQNFWRLGNK